MLLWVALQISTFCKLRLPPFDFHLAEFCAHIAAVKHGRAQFLSMKSLKCNLKVSGAALHCIDRTAGLKFFLVEGAAQHSAVVQGGEYFGHCPFLSCGFSLSSRSVSVSSTISVGFTAIGKVLLRWTSRPVWERSRILSSAMGSGSFVRCAIVRSMENKVTLTCS